MSLQTNDLAPGALSAAPASPDLLDGTIVDGSRGQYRVETATGTLLCTIRGRLRKELVYPTSANRHRTVAQAQTKAHDPVAVGDRVRVLSTGGGQGVIAEIYPRVGGAFSRADSDAGRVRGRVTPVAGVDQVVAVFAAHKPAPHLGLLDRILVQVEAQDLAAVVCLNKTDLGVDPALAAQLDGYAGLGYPVLYTSTATGTGLAELRARLAGHTSTLLGPSGVGKSSLLNALEPQLAQRVGLVSGLTHKGRHTTSGTRRVPLAGAAGGYLADTAGIRVLGVAGAAPGRLAWCFREFRPYAGTCAFANCAHIDEPVCAIRAAAARGGFFATRYAGYRRMYAEGANTATAAWADLV